jgi:hypothetical protein
MLTNHKIRPDRDELGLGCAGTLYQPILYKNHPTPSFRKSRRGMDLLSEKGPQVASMVKIWPRCK